MLRENVYIADQQVGRQAGVAYLGISSGRLRVPTAVVQALPLTYPICEYGIAIYWESLSDISLPVYTINCAKVYAGEMLGMWMSDSAVIWCMATDGMYKMIYLYVAIYSARLPWCFWGLEWIPSADQSACIHLAIA